MVLPFGPGPEPLTTPMEVEVWDYVAKNWVSHIPCPGFKRVRVDYYGDLSNLEVYEVIRRSNGFDLASKEYPPKPLTGWQIDYS